MPFCPKSPKSPLRRGVLPNRSPMFETTSTLVEIPRVRPTHGKVQRCLRPGALSDDDKRFEKSQVFSPGCWSPGRWNPNFKFSDQFTYLLLPHSCLRRLFQEYVFDFEVRLDLGITLRYFRGRKASESPGVIE
jgi:hypothetical protein